MRLCVVPARGGSKRIPRKNIRPFCGKPMLAWPLEAAIASGCFDKIIVSTDDAEIAETARELGAEVPFMRPAHLADDHATTAAAIAHAVQFHLDAGVPVDEVCCIYAPTPLLEPGDIQQGLSLLGVGDRDFAFPVASFPSRIARALRLTPAGGVEMFYPEHLTTRSQDLEDAYFDAGQFYWGRAQAWLENRPIYSARSAVLVLPRHRVQDIDTPEDWTHAEWMFRAVRSNSAADAGTAPP